MIFFWVASTLVELTGEFAKTKTYGELHETLKCMLRSKVISLCSSNHS